MHVSLSVGACMSQEEELFVCPNYKPQSWALLPDPQWSVVEEKHHKVCLNHQAHLSFFSQLEH